jgi:diadenosine tetraphosphatase ApaH/serine/threonine PP2A family protein phosphatase
VLDSLPKTVTLGVRGLGDVLFCHATPRDDEEFVLVESPLGRWAEVLDGAPDTVVCGHTHMPFVRLVDRRTIVNPGSVGMPYGTTGAHWALLGGADGPAIQLRRTHFDRASAADAIEAECDYPGIAEWTRGYLREPVSDTEALAVFTPKSRRADGPLG